MTEDNPIPSFDETYLEGGNEPQLASPPASRPELPIPRARRELKTAQQAVTTAMDTLTRIRHGHDTHLSPLAIDAIVCAALDRQVPLPDDDPRVEQLRERVSSGGLRDYVPPAIDELEAMLATLTAAEASLLVAMMLGELLPGSWANLPPMMLARKLNTLGHTVLRGRIPGTQL